MIRKNCENCGNFYWSLESKNRKYCSRSCSAQQQPIKKVEINCDGCGKDIERTPSLLNQNKGNYCSSECFYKNGRKGKVVKCDNCGEEVYKNPTELNKHNSENHYCSLRCAGEAKQKRSTRKCRNCDDKFEFKDFEPRPFCSRKCYEEHDNRLYPNTWPLRKKIIERRSSRRQRENLYDSYVKSVLTYNSNLKHNDIPQGIVEAKRQNLKIKRLIRNKSQ